MTNERHDLLSSLMQANSELLVYVVSAPGFKTSMLSAMIGDGSIPVETVLGKLPLFMPFLKREPALGQAMFTQLKEYRFMRPNVTLDELTNFLTLTESIQDIEPQAKALTVINMLV